MKRSDQRQSFYLGTSRLSVLLITFRLFLPLPLLLVLIPQARSTGHSPRLQVLLLNSHRQGMTWVKPVGRAFVKILGLEQYLSKARATVTMKVD